MTTAARPQQDIPGKDDLPEDHWRDREKVMAEQASEQTKERDDKREG